jgi:predicted permease
MSGLEWRLAVRHIRRAPLLSLTAALSLALAMTLIVTTAAVVKGLRFATLPVPGGEAVVMLRDYNRRGGWDVYITPEEFERRREALTSFGELAAFETVRMAVAEGTASTVRAAARVTPGLFPLLRVAPRAGRVFDGTDARSGAAVAVVRQGVLSQDPAALVGSRIRLDGRPHTVIGVMPEDFRFPFDQDVWVPLSREARAGSPSLRVVGRLAGGVAIERAEAELATVASASTRPAGAADLVRLVQPFTKAVGSANLDVIVWVLVGGVFGLLVVSAGNVANLLFVRHLDDARAMALCAALGGSRRRLMLPVLFEAGLVAGAACAMASVAGRVILQWLGRVVSDLPYWVRLRVDAGVLVAAGAAWLVTLVVAGAIPALRLTTASVAQAMHRDAFTWRLGRAGVLVVAAEIAVAVGFLAGAAAVGRGLLGFSYQGYELPDSPFLVAQVYFGQPPALAAGPPGIAPEARRELWSAHLAAAASQQRTIARRLAEQATVQEVTFASVFPGNEPIAARIEIDEAGTPIQTTTRIAEIDARFLPALGVAVRHGRAFTQADIDTRAPVALVNEPFARKYYRGAGAIGGRVRLAGGADGNGSGWLEIVGIVPDLGLNPGDPSRADGVYLPLPPTDIVRVGLRVAGDPGAVVQTLHEVASVVAPRAQVQWVRTLKEQVAEPVTIFRALGAGLLLLGGIALVLAAAGVYTTLAFLLARRRREIAIHVAVGASPRQAVSAIVRRVAPALVGGLAGGALLAVGILRAVTVIPFDLPAADTRLVLTMVTALAAAGVAACAAPVRRALRASPFDSLKET